MTGGPVDLSGRVALITGASRSIGASIAQRLADAGARVVLAARDGEALASAASQHLALGHPELVRSLVLTSTWPRADAYLRQVVKFLTWLPEMAPSERAMLEVFFVWIYTARAHEIGMVDAIMDDALAFPYPQSPEAFQRQLEAWGVHDTFDRLNEIRVPTLVIAGAEDIMTPPRYSQQVSELIPGAELVVLPGEAHQPFQESPDHDNDLMKAFFCQRRPGRLSPVQVYRLALQWPSYTGSDSISTTFDRPAG